jgi:uncharacterized repeat protein (TIGR03806 family)
MEKYARFLACVCALLAPSCADEVEVGPGADASDVADLTDDASDLGSDIADLSSDAPDLSEADLQDLPADGEYPESPHRPAATQTCRAPDAPPPPGNIAVERVFETAFPDGSAMPRATNLQQSPADPDIWFMTLQQGPVLRFSATAGAPEVVLDLGDELFLEHGETGVVGLALDPDFGEQPYVYLVYAHDLEAGFESRLSRFTMGPDGLLDPASELVILDVPQPHGSHSGNHVVFGPDGYLYYSLGDGQNNRPGRAQDPFNFYATILRIDVEGATSEAPYRIPPDNPFVAGPLEGLGAPEVFAYGFRNPWRFHIDAETGELWEGDVGQGSFEEVNLVVAGGNYGWPLLEGDMCYEAEAPCDDLDGLVGPVAVLPHRGPTSITMGPVYRGRAMPDLVGDVFYADFITGAIDRIEYDPATGESQTIRELETGIGVATIATDHEGEMYLLGYARDGSGGVYRVVPAPPPGPSSFPTRLSETGCVDPDDPREPAEGVFPFEPISPLWSDGAEKARFVWIPARRRIEVADDGDFELPVGSVLIKHFGYEGRLHETRLLIRHESGWQGYSYEWNDEQTDATLLDVGRAVTLESGVRWDYPSRSQCNACHTAAARTVLGLELRQLAPDTLESLFAVDLFPPEYARPEDLPGHAAAAPLVDPLGEEGDAEERARSYLHANCAGCHRPGGAGRGSFDLRSDVPFAETGLCDALPEEGTLYLPNGDELRLVVPGEPDLSILYLRPATLRQFRMPPLGTGIVDDEGLDVLREWIEGIEACP